MALNLQIEGTVGQIYALGKLARNLTMDEVRKIADNENESQIMFVSLKKLSRALDEAGFDEPKTARSNVKKPDIF